MHGYEMHELIGLDIFHLHTPEQLEFHLKNIYPEYKLNKEYSVKEFGRKRKDGSTFPGLVTAKQFYDEAGIPLFNAATVIDITERKNIEEQIREQNLRFKAIVDAIPDLIYIMDQDGNYTEYFSSNLENYIGDFNYLVGKNLKDVFTEADSDLHLSKISKALAENKIQTYEYAGMKGFEDRFFESRLIPMTSKKVLRFVREITERKKSESEIRKLNLAIEQSPVAIIITDLEGRLEYMNPSFLKMTGYAYEELYGKPVGLINPELTEPEIHTNLWQTISTGKNWEYEWQNKRKSGELYWENISITPITDEKGKIKNFLAVKQDITERKQYEEEIVSLNANLEERINQRTKELEKTNKELKKSRIEADSANQAKSEFLSRMSHELRTPMNSILGFAQLLELTELERSQKKSLEYILKSGNHLLQLINEVLEIAKIESGNLSISLEPVDLIKSIVEVIESVMPFAFNKSINISFLGAETEKLAVLADLQRLKQILINLLNNAIKYNYEHGNVQIYLDQIISSVGVKTVRITIQDNGIGIAEENIPKLFRPFVRVGNDNSEIEGTGLGLSVVEKLTKLMGGTLGVESSVGVGSKFWIELPATDRISEFPEDLSLSDPLGVLEDYTAKGSILLIEDNISNIELIKELLIRLKPESKLFTTMYGLEGHSLAKKLRPSLILLDLNLPDTHGAKVLETLKSDPETNGLPVIVLSADATSKQIEEMLMKGAERYVTKPINLSDMIAIFNQYL
jgi:PAS domain S-box-containing protein